MRASSVQNYLPVTASWPQDDPAIGFLGMLDPDQLEALHERGINRRFRKGQAIFHEGGTSDRVVILLSGRVKVSTTTPYTWQR